MVQRSFAHRFGVFVLPLAGLMVAACQPPTKTSAIAASGSEIVNGQEAKVADVGPKGLAESVVILEATLKTPDRKKDIGYALCTGTLIDPQVVLTAAHCVSEGVQALDVRVGLHFVSSKVSKSESKMTAYGAKAIIVNPGYAPSTGGQQQNDLALILLSKSVPTGTRVAQLPPANLDLGALDALLTIGYGQSDERHSAPDDNNGAGVLRYTTFPKDKFGVLPTSDDKNSDGGPTVAKMFQGMIATIADTTSVCHGDSGGPLMAMVKNSSPNMIVGVNDAVLPSYTGDEQKDYKAAMEADDMDPFYKKYPDANICSGGVNLFVNLAPQVGWIATSKDTLLSQTSGKSVMLSAIAPSSDSPSPSAPENGTAVNPE